jgi:hypothetical protein
VVGLTDLVEVVGPMTLEDLVKNASKAGFVADRLPYDRTFAWVFKKARRLNKPVPYKHPNGAVIWVKLPAEVVSAVLRQVTDN